MILASLIIHAFLLIAGYGSVVVFARQHLVRNPEESLDSFARRDAISVFGSVVSLGVVGSAALLYVLIALRLREEDTPARALLGEALPWAYALYGGVVVPAWMLFLESRINRNLRRMRYVYAMGAVVLAVVVWLSVLRHIVWFPGA